MASFQTSDRMQYEQVKYNTCVRLPDSGGGSWIVSPSLPSWVHHRSTGPSFDALQACVPLSISSHVHTVPDVLPLCSWPRTSLHLLEEGHNHPIVRTKSGMGCCSWDIFTCTYSYIIMCFIHVHLVYEEGDGPFLPLLYLHVNIPKS